MHYTTKYEGSDSEKRAQALKDTREFLGDERFEKLSRTLRDTDLTQENIETAVAFAGVQGFPAQVWAKNIIAQRLLTGRI